MKWSSRALRPSSHSAENALRWAHWQRLGERWFRRWLFALLGGAVGGALMVVGCWPQVQAHAQAQESVALLQQQLAKGPAHRLSTSTPPSTTSLTDTPVETSAEAVQNPQQPASAMGFSNVAQPSPLWPAVQQVLVGHGLRLLSMRPLLPDALQSPRGNPGTSALASPAVALRFSGRWEDWVGAWTTLSQAGPYCSIDRIAVQATAVPGEVQIDGVLRFWLLPGDAPLRAWLARLEGLQERRAATTASANAKGSLPGGPRSSGLPQGVTPLFAPPIGAVQTDRSPLEPSVNPTAASQNPSDDLPPDPQQWPLARLRWLGWWQQGAERQAIVAAGSHWARVRAGQRITREGHRVQALSEASLDLRLQSGPVVRLSLTQHNLPAHGGQEQPLKEAKP